MPERTRYLNVDLDLAHDESLEPLLEAWGEAVVVLHHEQRAEQGWWARLETSSETDSPERTIESFIELVRGLSPELRARWDRLDSRVLNVGIQAGAQPYCWAFELRPQTLAGIVEIGADLASTIYAPYEDDE